MPEYLAPGVYVEETSFRSKSIEGVSTTTTGLIGPTRFGPEDVEPEVITSLSQYEAIFGDRQQLQFTVVDPVTRAETPAAPMHNYMWHAVRAFFEEGGRRLYVARTFRGISEVNDGYAADWVSARNGAGQPVARELRVRARYQGQAGKMRVRLTLRLGQNALGADPPPASGARAVTTARSLLESDVVWISDVSSPPSPLSARAGRFYLVRSVEDPVTKESTWRFEGVGTAGSSAPIAGSGERLELSALSPDPGQGPDEVRVVTLAVTVLPAGGDAPPTVWDGLALSPGHQRAGEPDSVFARFARDPGSPALRRRIPIVFERQDNTGGGGAPWIEDGLDLLDLMLRTKPGLAAALNDPRSTEAARSVDLLLDGGNDGQRPEPGQYEGKAEESESAKTGLKGFEDIEDISIVAAPGSTYGFENGYRAEAATIMGMVISHAERMRYRIAVLDSGNDQSLADVRTMRARVDSKYAAFYYPWIRVLDPVTRQEINLPPSGFVAGIYARNDVNRAVYKAPANEVVNLAIGLENFVNKGQQEVLNPEGINCFRFFEGRGFRLWGARTTSSDPEWKYVNLRRYFAYLERSIDRGTQWAVFEPNGDRLWANVRRTIEDFLLNEWQSGALLGEKPERAYFVRCDRSTMTQNDLDNGRLICLIGVAPLRPAEFVIFRIGQWTSDRKG